MQRTINHLKDSATGVHADEDIVPEDANHWSHAIAETIVCVTKEGAIGIHGGSDSGEFPYLAEISGNVQYPNGCACLAAGALVLEIQGQKVVGYTERDVVAWLNNCTRNGNPCVVKTAPPGSLTRDLRQYLSSRFPKGGLDHELQNTIRDNVYLRTVPVTTRQQRPGEINGIDYTFLSHDEFRALQRSGSLLEAGVFEGNHYGTPKPPQGGDISRVSGGSSFLPGAHPTSEGKRRRNRSNVEAMAANSISDDQHLEGQSGSAGLSYMDSAPAGSPPQNMDSVPEELGPLPPNWEKAYTDNGEPYYIDHVAGTSSWLDPRLARVQKRSAEECCDDELPFGWERIDDPQYGTYYIDHVNRKTQYENPVAVARRQPDDTTLDTSYPIVPAANTSMDDVVSEAFSQGSQGKKSNSEYDNSLKHPIDNAHTYRSSKRSYSRSGASVFTRNPSELKGDFLRTTLVKSCRGLGFTIVGGDDNEEEFLQIKSVVPNGPAWQDAKLRTGDVLVYVNDTCVLGYTHADVVNMFQNIEPNRTVYLEVCRGYALPFDPNDPNTEIVTTVAVTSTDCRPKPTFDDFEGGRPTSESMNAAKSMPDLSNTERVSQIPRPGSADLLNADNFDADMVDAYPATLPKPEYLTIPIVKGSMGFGFTIADSAYGQKVKKILDRSRCKNLGEGDILVDINNINVKGMNHTEVVQVLKECSLNQEAIVMVQRGGHSSPSATKNKPLSPNKLTSSGLYRSKTPTADMYSSQPKQIIPNRPKTPIVDTRQRSKTPNSYLDPHIEVRPEPLDHYHSSDNPPYPGAFAYTQANPTQDSKINTLSNQMAQTSLNGNSFDKFGHYNTNNTDAMTAGYHHPHRDVYKYPTNPAAYYEDQHPVNKHQYYNNDSRVNPAGGYPDVNSPQENYGGYGYMPSYPKDSYDNPRQDSGYSSQTQIPPSKNPFPPYHGQNSSLGYNGPPPPPRNNSFDHNDNRRREYTSFELEHPSSVTASSAGLPFPSPATGAYQNGATTPLYDFTVTLRRKESGFGFRIVGGTEEGSQVSIGQIVKGGAAQEEGSVINGDEIIGVDGEMVFGSSHQRVVQLMSAAAAKGQVTLTLRRHGPTNMKPQADVHNQSMDIQYPYDVMVTRRENEGFGFVIISSVAKAGSTIGRIIEGSPAERCTKLHVGDRILRVNGVEIKSLHHVSIVNLIKESGYQVCLTIGQPRDDASSTTSNSQRVSFNRGVHTLPKTNINRVVCLPSRYPKAESELGEDGEMYQVDLERGNRGFGFSIRGGLEFNNMPLFVLRIAENGPAAENNKLKVGDQLVEVNKVSTREMTHAEAIELIKQCGNSISLLIRRGAKLNQQFDPMSSGNMVSPVGPPLPGTHIRSAANLPTGSPNHNPTSYHSTASLPSHMAYQQYNYPHYMPNAASRQPMHSPPGAQYGHLGPNGPLGQSSPRVPQVDINWNRPQH